MLFSIGISEEYIFFKFPLPYLIERLNKLIDTDTSYGNDYLIYLSHLSLSIRHSLTPLLTLFIVVDILSTLRSNCNGDIHLAASYLRYYLEVSYSPLLTPFNDYISIGNSLSSSTIQRGMGFV